MGSLRYVAATGPCPLPSTSFSLASSFVLSFTVSVTVIVTISLISLMIGVG